MEKYNYKVISKQDIEKIFNEIRQEKPERKFIIFTSKKNIENINKAFYEEIKRLYG